MIMTWKYCDDKIIIIMLSEQLYYVIITNKIDFVSECARRKHYDLYCDDAYFSIIFRIKKRFIG